jgi:hypothetical protein
VPIALAALGIVGDDVGDVHMHPGDGHRDGDGAEDALKASLCDISDSIRHRDDRVVVLDGDDQGDTGVDIPVGVDAHRCHLTVRKRVERPLQRLSENLLAHVIDTAACTCLHRVRATVTLHDLVQHAFGYLDPAFVGVSDEGGRRTLQGRRMSGQVGRLVGSRMGRNYDGRAYRLCVTPDGVRVGLRHNFLPCAY